MAPRAISLVWVSATLLLLLGSRASPAQAFAQPADLGADLEADPIDEAKRLFDLGADAFETADYARAIELWTTAYGLVPSTPAYAPTKAKLIANLASAHERAYAVDDKTDHLNQAKILLQSYRAGIEAAYPSAEERAKELAWVDERVATIDAELQAVAERRAAQAKLASGTDQAARAARAAQRRAQGLVIGGSVVIGLGVGGLGLMIGGMVVGGRSNDIADLPPTELDARAARFDQGRLGNNLAIVGGVGGAVLLGTGVALIMIGLKQKRAASPTRATLVPVLDRTQLGLGLLGRF